MMLMLIRIIYYSELFSKSHSFLADVSWVGEIGLIIACDEVAKRDTQMDV